MNEGDSFIRKREILNLSNGRGLKLNGTTLIFESVNRNNAGTYSITGINSVGIGNASFNLIVFCK